MSNGKLPSWLLPCAASGIACLALGAVVGGMSAKLFVSPKVVTPEIVTKIVEAKPPAVAPKAATKKTVDNVDDIIAPKIDVKKLPILDHYVIRHTLNIGCSLNGLADLLGRPDRTTDYSERHQSWTYIRRTRNEVTGRLDTMCIITIRDGVPVEASFN